MFLKSAFSKTSI